MLSAVKDLERWTIHALDGEIGKVVEVLFDDEHWTVRYLVVETSAWLFARKVLISPAAFDHVESERCQLHCNLTREQIKHSPDVDTAKPVSRQWETAYYGYYGLPSYWGGKGGGRSYGSPGMLAAQPRRIGGMTPAEVQQRMHEHNDCHLRSIKEVTGYKILATDGHLGHIDDFIVDEETWKIRYLAVDTRDWWPGKKVLLPPDWIGQMSWMERGVMVDVTRDQVRNAPEWDTSQRIARTAEERFYKYYARQGYWEQERVHELAS